MLLDREATFDLVDELTERAAREGAQLVAFPEAFVPRGRRCGSTRCGSQATRSGTRF